MQYLLCITINILPFFVNYRCCQMLLFSSIAAASCRCSPVLLLPAVAAHSKYDYISNMVTLKAAVKSLRMLAISAVLIPVHLYRFILSPFLPPSCIYTPTCSQYTIHAFRKHGILKGAVLSLTRIGRCHGAFFSGGEDPVPDQFALSSIADDYRKRLKKRRRKSED